MLNTVSFVGFAIASKRDNKVVDLRQTNNGKNVAQARISVPRNYKNNDGQTPSDFIPVRIWGNSATNFANWITEHSKVAIQGSLRTEMYQDQNGQTHFTWYVLVENFDVLDSKEESQKKINAYQQKLANGGQQQGSNVTNNGQGNSQVNNGTTNTTTTTTQPTNNQPVNNNNQNVNSQNNNGQTNNTQNGGQDPFAGSGDTIDISDDDLPF